MNPKKVYLLIWDNTTNFELPATQRQLGSGNIYRSIINFNSLADFEAKVIYNQNIKQEDLLIFSCHIDYTDFSEYLNLRNSGILEKYSIPRTVYVSSADSGDVVNKLYKTHKKTEVVILYNELIDKIKSDEITPFNKRDIIKDGTESSLSNENTIINKNERSDIHYAIITALYEDEFLEVEKFFDWEAIEDTKTIRYRIGSLKGNKNKKVVAAVQNKTGMIDAAILATHIVETYKPKYLLMPGVCGGIPTLPLGSIIIASGVFTFQRGKISDYKDSKGKIVNEFFDSREQLIDLSQIYDKNKNHLKVSIEKFEPENDLIEIDLLVKSKIDSSVESISFKINEPYKLEGNKKIKIVFEKMACSSMVIDKTDYFNDNIKPIDRKVVGVEMESYGIARACQFANDGQTKFLIFKSVMDNTVRKRDNSKSLAAYTSALFLKYLLEDNVLE